MYLATYQSRHFTFDALGATERQAIQALRDGLAVHAGQYKLRPGWYAAEDITTRPMVTGVAYRDSEPLPAA